MTTSDTCRNCGTPLGAGASVCVRCGAGVANRAARMTVVVPEAARQPAPPAQPEPSAAQRKDVPGIIAVTPFAHGPVVPVTPSGSAVGTSAKLALVPAGAGRRLCAWLLDGVIPGLLVGIGFGVGATTITAVQSSLTTKQLNLTGLFIWAGAALLLAFVYWVLMWWWEARTGKTLGNLLLGIRSATMEGYAPGLLAVLVRSLVVGVAGIVPVIGPVLVLISNLWDQNGQRQGWHDKAAHTLVFNVNAGRNPLETGGVDGPSSFAPAAQPPVLAVPSPMAPRQQPAAEPLPLNPNQWQPPSSAAGTNQGTWAPPLPGNPHPDEEFAATRYRPAPPAPAPTGGISIVFDDGRTERINAQALIGRNPSGYDGEMIDTLLEVQDATRSISKTHLYLRAEYDGVWVTDRNSTNGSAITLPGAARTPLVGGQPVKAPVGSTVHFGDRSFRVGHS